MQDGKGRKGETGFICQPATHNFQLDQASTCPLGSVQKSDLVGLYCRGESQLTIVLCVHSWGQGGDTARGFCAFLVAQDRVGMSQDICHFQIAPAGSIAIRSSYSLSVSTRSKEIFFIGTNRWRKH